MTAQPHASAPSAPAAGAGSYLGYRWPPASTALRMPSGEHVVLPGTQAQLLAEAVLRDFLGERPCAYLSEAFVREWVRPFGRGEFSWPVAAVDQWVAEATAARVAERCSDWPGERLLDLTRRALGAPLAHHPLRPSTPIHRGAH